MTRRSAARTASLENGPNTPDVKSSGEKVDNYGHSHATAHVVPYDGSSQQAHWDVQILEAGVIFHSIMIGVTLGAQANGFVPTFIAIIFHQLFEGLALGARIATLVWPDGRNWKKWLMVGAYTIITPVGIAIVSAPLIPDLIFVDVMRLN
jgi:zinc transporter 1/2/3